MSVRDNRFSVSGDGIGGIADHLGWLILGMVTAILLSMESIPALPRFASSGKWYLTLGVTTAVVSALLWFIAEKGIRILVGEAMVARSVRRGARSGVRHVESPRLGSRALPTATLWAFGVLAGAVVEELFWRGVMWQLLSKSAGLSTPWVVTVTSVGFAITHLNSGLASATSKLLGGFLLGAWVVLFESVLLATVMHLSFNALVLYQYRAWDSHMEMEQSK